MADNNQLKTYTEAEVQQAIVDIVVDVLYGYEPDMPSDYNIFDDYPNFLNQDLTESHGLDSLDAVKIETEIGIKFNIDTYDKLYKFKTINDIMNYLRKNYGFKDSPKIIVAWIMTRKNLINMTKRKNNGGR
ncbi:MAG: acyl carrier protein [Alphaproteobacteria bacterium]|nr:acyl carrier protein [Alphaproteobacteria bacterium]